MCLQIHPLSLEPLSEAQARDSQRRQHRPYSTSHVWGCRHLNAFFCHMERTFTVSFMWMHLVKEQPVKRGEVRNSIPFIVGEWEICLCSNSKITWNEICYYDIRGSLLMAEHLFASQAFFKVGRLSSSWTWGCFARRKRRGLRYQRPRTLSTASTPHLTPSAAASWVCRHNGKAW